MPIHKTEALVLSRRDFRETSLIANFYTRDFGKLSGILKGIRKDPRKFASNLEPFSHNEIIFYRSRSSSLHLVSQCDAKDNFSPLRQDIRRIGLANLMMELLDAVMAPEDRNEAIFDLGLTGLRELAVADNPERIMQIFKIKVLSLSGFKPHFDSCVSCNSGIYTQSRFSLMLGGLLCPACFHKDLKSRLIFRGTTATVLYIEKNDFRASLTLGMNYAIKKELDLILDAFLNFHLEREFKSQKVMRALIVPQEVK